MVGQSDACELQATKEGEGKLGGHFGAVKVHKAGLRHRGLCGIRGCKSPKTSGLQVATWEWSSGQWLRGTYLILAGEPKLGPWLLTKGRWEILQPVRG